MLRSTRLFNALNRTRVAPHRFPTTVPRFKSSDSQQKAETKQRRKGVVRNVLIGYALASGLVGLWFYREYQNDPLRSMADRVLRWSGGPYRDYLYIDSESELAEGPRYKRKNPDMSLLITAKKFVRPGLIIRDDIDPAGNGGSLEIEDDFGNYVVCDWVRLEETDRINASEEELAVLEKNFNKFEEMIEKSGSKQSYLEVVDTKKCTSSKPDHVIPKEICETCPAFVFAAYVDPKFYKDTNSRFYEHHGVPPNNDMWNGSIVFLHDGHFFAITARYPNNMINYAILSEKMREKGSSEEEIHKKLSASSEKIHPRLREMEKESTYAKREIIDQLRYECFEYMLNFFQDYKKQKA